MAIKKVPQLTSLSIEVQTSIDKAGDPIYTKKTFSGLRTDVDPQNAYDVADAIMLIIDASTRDVFLNTAESLVNA